MKYNFLNPSETSRFKQEMSSKGYSSDDINSYISSKTGGQNTLKQQSEAIGYQASILKSQKDIDEISGDYIDKDKYNDALEGVRLVDDILGSNTDPLTGDIRLGGIPLINRSKVNTTKAKIERLQGVLQLAISGKLKGQGQMSDKEREMLANAASSLKYNQTDESFREELSRIKRVFQKTTGVQQPDDFISGSGITSPDQAISTQPQTMDQFINTKQTPVFNVKGQIAQPGDVLLSDVQGEFKRMGQAPQTFREHKETGFAVDNELVNFLADSWLVPVIGSVVGGIAGVGVGSIATGAAGAVVGKGIQQWAKEIRDPEAYDMSDHARILVTEGVTDAVIGGLTMGTGKIVIKGLSKYGIVLGKVAVEGAEEAVEGGIKKGFGRGLEESFIRKATNISPKQARSFAFSSGGKEYVEEVAKRGIPKNATAQVDEAITGLSKASRELNELLSGKTVSKKTLLETLEASKKPFMIDGNVLPSAETGIKRIQKDIDFINKVFSDVDEIPAKNVQTIKQGLQEAWGKSLDITKSSQKVVTQTSTQVKKLLETIDPKIAGTNREIIFNRLHLDLGQAVLDKQKAKALLDIGDWIILPAVMAGGPGGGVTTILAKKAIQKVVSETYLQARLVSSIVNLASQAGNKPVVRSFLLAATKLGIPFSIDPSLIKKGIKEGAESLVGQSFTQPLSQPQTPDDFIQPTQGISSPSQMVR